MTARQMVYDLQSQLLNLFGDSIYEIKTIDLLYYLNKAQNQIIKEKVQQFEQNQYLTDELRTLIKEVNLNLSSPSSKIEASLPNDYSLLLKHKCETNSNCGPQVVPGRIVQLDDIGQLLKDPFSRPTRDEPLYYVINNKLIYEIPDESFAVINVFITYIKKEAQISITSVSGSSDVDSELPEYLHEEIITIARRLIIEDKQLK